MRTLTKRQREVAESSLRVAACDWFACNTLYDMVKEMGLL